MGGIINRIKLVGSKGEKKVDGLFDSGVSFSHKIGFGIKAGYDTSVAETP